MSSDPINRRDFVRATAGVGLAAATPISLGASPVGAPAVRRSAVRPLVIAAESAKFNQAFVKIGLVPDCGGTFILPRLVGWKRAAELMFTGDMITAQRAAEMGMINSVTPDTDLMAAATTLADRLAKAPTAAIELTEGASSCSGQSTPPASPSVFSSQTSPTRGQPHASWAARSANAATS